MNTVAATAQEHHKAQEGQRRAGARQALLKAADVAAWLDTSEWRVYDLVRQGLIPHVKMGRNVRFVESAVQSWLDSGGTPLPQEAA